MPNSEPKKGAGGTTDALFRIGLVIKGVDALFEVVGGFLLFAHVRLSGWLLKVSQHELYRDHETTARHLQKAAEKLAEASPWAAVYLVIHGLAKVVLILAVFKGKRWGFQWLIAVLSIFAVGEVIQGVIKRDAFPLVMAVFDAVVVFLIAKEYRARSKDL